MTKRKVTKKQALLGEYIKSLKDLQRQIENELLIFSNREEVIRDNLPPLGAISDTAIRVAKNAEIYRGFIMGEES